MIKNIKNKTSTYYTHGFHPYPAKFTPQIVNKYFNIFCHQGFTILDPFCGSGTAIVEGILNGMDSTGIDLNPIAYIISRAKTNKYTKKDIRLIREFVLKLQPNNNGLFTKNEIELFGKIKVPDFPNRDHWLQDNVSNDLAVLKKHIDLIRNNNVKDLLYCAFSKIIVKVSNQDSEVRYTAKEKNHPDGIVFSAFTDTIINYLQALNTNEHSIYADAKVYNGDTRKILKKLPENHYDFIITSPRHINTFDYYLYHKQRMFWLGFDHKPVRQNEIGNHHRIDTKTFEAAKSEYINSMTQIMNELSRVSKPDSFFVMIIGDGIIEGTTIDMNRVITEICYQSNYSIEKTESVNLSDITKSFNEKFSNAKKKEHTIILKNNK